MNSNLHRWRRALCCIGMLASALLVASCGGGSRVQNFQPSRLIVFGDETSAIEDVNGDANGRKYLDNATVSATDPTLNCKANPNWVQALGSTYGFVFPQCNPGPTPVAAPPSRDRAVAGAKVADIPAQIAAQVAESPFNSTTLVAILVGHNDILAQYALYNGSNEAALTATLEASGVALGNIVNDIASTGAKVLIATAMDEGLTPFATAENAANPGSDRAGLLTRLTARFNATMRATIINDGRMIGLVLNDEYFRTIYLTAGGGGFTNLSTPICTTPLPNCTSLTLAAGTTGSTFLWADPTHLSSGAHTQLGAVASIRAVNNPF